MASTLEEHLAYLKLQGRLALFKRALALTVEEGHIVADLGCGVGVLGMAALNAGASQVIGIDHSDAIELARETVARAGMADRYSCVRASTYRYEPPEKVDVLLCDHVGFFGFDYGLIAMLRDAKSRMLKDGGCVVPRRLRLVLAGVSSEECRAIAQAWDDEAIPEELRWIDSYARNTKYAHDLVAGQLCTSPVTLASIDLGEDGPALFTYETEVIAERETVFDGLAGWFDCDLAEGVSMTNSPLEPAAIARSQAFLPCETPFAVSTGDRVKVTLRFRADGDMVAWTICPPDGAAQSMSTWKSRILTQADLKAEIGQDLTLNQIGRARAALIAAIDGTKSANEIADAVVSTHPDLFPTESELRRFIKRELRHITG